VELLVWDDDGQFIDDSLLHWKTVKTAELWRHMITSPRTCEKTRRRILNRLETPKQGVLDGMKQRIAIVQATRYERLD